MGKRILFILLIFFMLGVVGYFYINNVFLPIKFKNFVESRAQTHLSRKVSLGNIGFQPVKGFILSDVKIFEQDNTRVFAQIKEISFNILLAPILKQKNIIIPTVRIDQPNIHIQRKPNNQWNFSDLLKRPKTSPSETEYQFFLRKFTLNNGQINYVDQTFASEFVESFHHVHAQAVITVDKTVEFEFNSTLADAYSKFSLNGTYDISKKNVDSKLTFSNIPLISYLPYIGKDVPLQKGLLSYGDLSFLSENNNILLSGHLTLDEMLYAPRKNQFFEGSLNINNAKIKYSEGLLEGSAKIDIPNLNAQLSKDSHLKSHFTFDITSFTQTPSTFGIFGDLSLAKLNITNKEQTIESEIKAPNTSIQSHNGTIVISTAINANDTKIQISDEQSITAQMDTTSTKIVVKDKTIDIMTKLKLTNSKISLNDFLAETQLIQTDNLSLSIFDNTLELSADAVFDKNKTQLKDGVIFEGSPTLSVIYAPDQQQEYSGKMSIDQATLKNAPQLGDLNKVSGDIFFTPESLTTNKLSFQLQDIDVTTSGTITDFENIQLNAQLKSPNVNLETLSSLFPDIAQKVPAMIKGKANVTASFKGPINNIDASEILLTTQLRDATIKTNALEDKPFEDVEGTLTYTKDFVTWKDLKTYFDGSSYTLNGYLKNFSRPSLSTTVSSRDLNLETDMNLLRGAIQFIALEGSYRRSAFDIKGDVKFMDMPPKLDLRGTFELYIDDLSHLSPQIKEQIDAQKISGTLNGEGLFKGDIKDWRHWQLTFDAQSRELSAQGFTLKNATFKFGQRDTSISEFDLTGTLYDGRVAITSKLDLRENNIPFDAEILIEELDLNKWRLDKGLKDKHFAGDLTLMSKVSGQAKNLNTITGKGSLLVTNAYLWHLIPQYSDIDFTDAQATFKIADQKIKTNDMKLLSQTIILSGEGAVNFDKNYQFHITPMPRDVSVHSRNIQFDASKLLRQVVNIKCKGKVGEGKPNCSPEVDMLKAPTEILKGVGGILGGLLQ